MSLLAADESFGSTTSMPASWLSAGLTLRDGDAFHAHGYRHRPPGDDRVVVPTAIEKPGLPDPSVAFPYPRSHRNGSSTALAISAASATASSPKRKTMTMPVVGTETHMFI